MLKIATVVGARPQFVKAAVVSKALQNRDGLSEIMIHSGQHYDFEMSEAFFRELALQKPKHSLEVGSGGHGRQTGEIMKRLEPVLIAEAPEAVLVYGDTNTTLAGALTAVKLHIPVAHVEAGLRSFNRVMPEEINRIVADHVSTLLFCPTLTAVENLASEGIRQGVVKTGDVMYDAAVRFGPVAEQKSDILPRLGLHRREYLLATVHREENAASRARLEAVLAALDRLSAQITVVAPLHPGTRKQIHRHGLSQLLERVLTTGPLGYWDMTTLIRNAALICTDSGGVQKEACFHRVACVTLREETEWNETIQAGWNRLAPPLCAETVVQTIQAAMASGTPERGVDGFGDGRASERIVDALCARFGRQREKAGLYEI